MKKIAIIHDDFIQWGGAERLVGAMAQAFPQAPIYTSMLNPDIVAKSGIPIDRFHVSWLNNIPSKNFSNKILFPLYPIVFENFNLDDYDVVFSSSTRFAHSVVTKPHTKHISYINSPFRGFWEPNLYFGSTLAGRILNSVLLPSLSGLRQWDYLAGQRPDYIIANSGTSRSRVKKYYRREADVIYPFVDLERFSHEEKPKIALPDNYYVIVSRLVEWKKLSIAVEAFNQMQRNLVIIGSGPYKSTLRGMAGPTVNVVDEYLDDPGVTYVLKRAQGLIHPQKEDFGMTVVEANACGVPVVAFAEGGASETIIPMETGVLFFQQTADSIKKAIEKFETISFEREKLINNANKFRRENFIRQITEYVESHS
jgi:glycosyltransferase involved in cell wall biosynthesis